MRVSKRVCIETCALCVYVPHGLVGLCLPRVCVCVCVCACIRVRVCRCVCGVVLHKPAMSLWAFTPLSLTFRQQRSHLKV